MKISTKWLVLLAPIYLGPLLASAQQQSKLSWQPSPATVAPCKTATIYINPNGGTAPADGVALNVDAIDAAGNKTSAPAGTVVIVTDKSATSKDGASGNTASEQNVATVTLADNTTTVQLSGLTVGKHTLVATIEGSTKIKAATSDPEIITLQAAGVAGQCIHQMPPINMSLAGINIEGASSTSPAATFLGMESMDIPLWQKRGSSQPLSDIRDVRAFFTGSFRLAGMAQPGALSAAAFTSNYYASAINATPDKIVQSWEGSVALSFPMPFLTRTIAVGSFDDGTPASKDAPRQTLITVAPLITGGFNSPVSASQASPPVYYATNQIIGMYPKQGWAASCSYTTGNPPCYVAFIPSDRTRFYRFYEAGFRLRVYGEDFEHNMLRYPGTLDITVGQNEYVTGGSLRGIVAHTSGVMPIPIPKVDGVYAFGSINSELNGQVGGGAQLLLTPAPSTANVTYTSTNVYDITVSQPNRDRFRFGIGIDLIHLLTTKPSSSTTVSDK